VSVCKTVYKDDRLLGVAAVDLRLADLLTEVTYYNGGEYSYAFIIDKTGRTLVHPLLLRPSVKSTGRVSVDISSLESINVVNQVIPHMKRLVMYIVSMSRGLQCQFCIVIWNDLLV